MTRQDTTTPEAEAEAEALARLGQALQGDLEGAGEDRRELLEGVRALRDGQLDQAVRLFRRARRRGQAPFDALAQVALGECLRVQGKEGAALRAWRGVAEDEQAPGAARHVAWLSCAALYQGRGEAALAASAAGAAEACAP